MTKLVHSRFLCEQAVMVSGICRRRDQSFFCILYIGKIHDIWAHTIQAARYAAWKRTVYDNANFSGFLIQRFAAMRMNRTVN